jgi:signal transduction histidine kinase
MKKLIDYVVLPEAVSDFEARYLARINRITLWFFAAHIPALTILAAANGTSATAAALLSTVVFAGPLLAARLLAHPRAVSTVYGVTSMLMGALLVHFGQGPMQIEMHFYFFVSLALLAVFANPVVIVTAAGTVAVHHLALWFLMPSSVFNYDAPIWVVLVHALFVVLESVAACFIARSFFDNVIGLEKIVEARTAALDARNRDLRIVLDNVSQGFLTLNGEGRIASEWSAVVGAWFGVPEPGMPFGELVGRRDPRFDGSFALGWEQVVSDFLPIELTLEQLPREAQVSERHLRFDYQTIAGAQATGGLSVLVVITDVTESLERQRVEAEQKETLAILDVLMRDKAGFIEFMAEGDRLVDAVCDPQASDRVTFQRQLHTLKGIASLFGLHSVAQHCHGLESFTEDHDVLPPPGERTALQQRWERLRCHLGHLIGERSNSCIEVAPREVQSLLNAIRNATPHELLARAVHEWTLEPTRARLERFALQAKQLARRLDKGDLVVAVEDNGVRLDSQRWGGFWSAFVHTIRNAVDHGVERDIERAAVGKLPQATLTLRTRREGADVVIEVNDDGRGIDWEKVRAKARDRGLRHDSQDALVEALFADGLSTAAATTDLSGRGVGMGAVRSECASLGGRVSVISQLGRGTTFQFRVPPPLRPVEIGAGAVSYAVAQ